MSFAPGDVELAAVDQDGQIVLVNAVLSVDKGQPFVHSVEVITKADSLSEIFDIAPEAVQIAYESGLVSYEKLLTAVGS